MRQEHEDIRPVSSGSSLKICLVAEGSADVYPRFAPTMEWDTAAMQIICEEAGGIYTDGAGNKVPANRADPVNHGGFIILNRPESALELPAPEKTK